jgi:hypothetical protein
VILYPDICCLAYYFNTFTILAIYCQMYLFTFHFFTLAIIFFKSEFFAIINVEKNKIGKLNVGFGYKDDIVWLCL